MKTQKILLCLCLFLSLFGCDSNNNESSSLEEERFYTIYLGVSFNNQDYPNFNEKFLSTCSKDSIISNKTQKIDYEKYQIDFDTLVAGECICIETSTFRQYGACRITDKGWYNTLTFDGEVLNMYVQKAEVVELSIEKKDNEYKFVNEKNLDIEYRMAIFNYISLDLYDEDSYTFVVFNSLIGGEDYTLIDEIEEGTKVYGTYIKNGIKDNRCTLSTLYSFNPYE